MSDDHETLAKDVAAEIAAAKVHLENAEKRLSLHESHALATAPSDDLHWKHPRNQLQLVGALLLAAWGVLALAFGWHRIGFVVAVGTNVFVGVLLLEMSLRKGLNEPRFFELAHRAYYVLIVLFLAVALVTGFAMLYLESGDVYRGNDKLATVSDAVYFSTVTIMTLGYGDFVPTSQSGRRLVVWQLASGASLLLVILPVLASRLALLGQGN